MQREDIEQQYKWRVEEVFPSDEAFERALAEFEAEYADFDFEKYKGKLGDKQALLDCFLMNDALSRRIEVLYLYAHLRHDENVKIAKYTSAHAKVAGLIATLFSRLSYIEPELTALPEATLRGFIADPDFAAYDYKLAKIAASKAHVLSEGEERLLALSSDVLRDFYSVFSMLDNANLNLPKATLNGEEAQMSHSLYGLVLHSENQAERKEWFEKYYGAYEKLLDALSQTYVSNVKKDVFYQTARKYASCMEMAMDAEDVQPIVYENLLKAVRGALPTLHDYMRTRKQILGGGEQHMYDVYAPLVENADVKLPFDEAYELIIEGLAPLGKDYQALLRKARNEGWMDVYENEGKRNGAYAAGIYDSHPYVLLNYQQTTNDVFAVAHEMGHALHTYKANQAQPYAKADYTIFLAEIASTVNEVLLVKHLYKKTEDKNLKKYLLSYYMDTIRATLFRQTHFAEFEQIAHAKAESGEALTKESLSEVYYQLNQDYYGDGVTHDKQIAYEWARIPHFYNAFYVYKYATGIISAISIVKRILSEGEPAVKDYFTFLSSGGCAAPVRILQQAGVDLTTEAPFEAAMQEFADTLAEFKSLL